MGNGLRISGKVRIGQSIHSCPCRSILNHKRAVIYARDCKMRVYTCDFTNPATGAAPYIEHIKDLLW
jgi:hypothetical protein